MTAPPKTSSARVLRPYQDEAVEAILEGWKESRSQLLVLPTGAGKTIVFAEIIRRTPGRVLVLAHREELLSQAREKIQSWAGEKVALERAQAVASRKARIVVASIQTMRRRLDRWPWSHFELVVVDEAHHSAALSYRSIIKHFDCANLLGCTATPYRADQKDLGELFERVAYETPLLRLIKDGYLSNIRVDTLPVTIDLGNVRRKAGDFDEGDLGHALEPHLEAIARILAKEFRTRRILAFLPLIATSKRFVQACRKAGIEAAHIDGGSEDRAPILSRFEQGKVTLLSNAMLLTEGFDCPPIDAVLILRPTRSRTLYAQMIGRGTRLCDGKDHLLVLDPTFRHARMNILSAASLAAKDQKEEEALARHLREGRSLSEAVSEAAAERQAALARALEERVERVTGELARLELALNIPGFENYSPVLRWEKEPPSEKQRAILEEAGVSGITSKGAASLIIDGIVRRSRAGLCTLKQGAFITRNRLHPDPYSLTKDEAGRIIDETITKWRRRT